MAQAPDAAANATPDANPAADRPDLRPVAACLRDGTPVLIRPIGPADKQHLKDGLKRLSETSRHHRFLGSVRTLSEDQLRAFTEIDYRDHMAWIAFDLGPPGGLAVGVARYVRLGDEPEAAEAAVTVVDSHQGRGLGTLLLALLSRSAAGQGVRRFVAYVLADNTAMLNLFRDLGARVAREGAGLVQVTVPVPQGDDEIPQTTAGKVFKSLAERFTAPAAPAAPDRRRSGARRRPRYRPGR